MGFMLLCAVPFAALYFLPPVWAAMLGQALSVLGGLAAGWLGGVIFGLEGFLMAGLFAYFVGSAFTGLVIAMRMEQRGVLPRGTVSLLGP